MIIRFAVLFLFSGFLAAFPLFGADAPGSAWSLCVESPEPVVRHGAGKLLEFLNGNGRIVRNGARRLVVAVAPEKDRLTSRITVTDDEVRVTGATPREVLQGCYRLMDELENGEEHPVLRPGTRTYTRMFSPRMVHSGVEIEKYPDAHMDEIARAGLDAILIYINEPPDGTRNGHEDIPALVKRAAEHGLDVYAYADFYWNPILKNPCDSGAEDYYDSVFGSIVRNAPGLRGLICVGESCYFPERGESPWKDGSARPDRHNGWQPHPDWAEFLKVVTRVTRRHNPDFDVVFWTYNWYRRPEKDRLALLERIPTNVTVHVTFEMGAPAYEKDDVEFHVDDYSITEPGPGTTFVSEARVCARRGIPLTSMTNTGGRTWDFGGLAFEPVPQAWMARFDRVRDAQAHWGLKGLMDSHHYGFTPNVVAKVAKAAFTRESGEREIAAALRTAAACDFGPDAADEVLSAWKDWSEAFQWHSARRYDQWGPLRIGPSYPLVRPGAPFPPSPRPVYEWVKGKRNGNGWLYLAPSYDCPPESLDGRIRTDERELALLRRGNSRLEAVLNRVPAARLPAARRMLGYGKYMEAAVRTLRNVRAYKKACLAGDEAARLRVLDDEEANVRAILPWVEQDEKLGWEPSMRRVTDAFMLKWKLGLLEDARMADVTVTFDRPNRGPEWVMPVGAGDLSAMVSVVSNAVEIHLSKTDYLAEANVDNPMKGLQLLSPGHVTLAFGSLSTNDFTSFRQTLDPRAGTVSVAIGTAEGTIEAVLYGDRASGALFADVTDARRTRGTAKAEYSIWRTGKGLIPEYAVSTEILGDPASERYSVMIACGAKSAAAARTTDREGRRAALAKWWADFWAKGFVDLSGDAKAERLTQLWWVNMYGYASVGYGPVPPKFNGGAGLVQGDRRHWGKDLWYQNTREMIWPMCVAGHSEFAKAILDFYDSCYANVLANTPKRYPEMVGTEALVLPETMPFLDSAKYTPPKAPVPDVRRPYREPTDAERVASREKRLARRAAHTTHVYSSGTELLQQMIEYVRFTGDRAYLSVIARWLRGAAELYLVLLERGEDGLWHVRATNVNESWWVKDDSIVDLAAARFAFVQTVAHGHEFGFPENLIAAAKDRLESLAPYPTAESLMWEGRPFRTVGSVTPGDRIFLPCALKAGDQKRNSENNEIYLVFPFALCEDGVMRERMLRTYPESYDAKCGDYGWSPVSVAAARLRLSNAANLVYSHAVATARWPYGGGRSPSQKLYPGADVEEAPYLDGTGVTLTGIQELLLQSHPEEPSADLFGGGPVRKCPGVPPNWKVRFRLHARGGSIVEVSFANGQIW